MYKNIVCNFILIFIIIKYVKSQDNNPDQPADDEDEDDNFDVLDIEQIIQERLSRFDDPRYQPQYQQIQPGQEYYPEYQFQTPQIQAQPQPYDHYQPHLFHTQLEQLEEQQYHYYQPAPTQSVTQETYHYYVPPTTQQQPQVTQQQYYQHYGPPHTQTEITQPATQYITPPQEQVAQQQTHEPRRKKRTRTRSTSGYEDEEGEEQKPKRGRKFKSYRISKKLKFYKRNYLGNMVEMTSEDYDITHSDSTKSKYRFNANLEQIEFNNEVIYRHSDGTPYSLLLTHSKENVVFVMTNSDGFILIKRIKGKWTRTDAEISDDVKLYAQDSGGNDVLLTSNDYIIDLNSFGSFKYTFLPGVKCTKIIVNGLVAWEKTDEDDGFPEFINVSTELTVMVKFEKYTRTYGRRLRNYQHLYTRKKLKNP